MTDFVNLTLKQMPNWALMAQGVVQATLGEEIVQHINAGGNLPDEWKSHELIVLENTRRSYRPYDRSNPTSKFPNGEQHFVPDTIVDAFWFDHEQGKWEADWIKAPIDGWGNVYRGTMSVCQM